MTRIHGILTLATIVALTGCASDNMTWQDTKGNPDNTANTAVRNDGSLNHQALPDNPQLGGGNDKNASALSDYDRTFIATALSAGQYEISASDKANTHAGNEVVKSLAQYIMEDHMKANAQLTNLASRRGLTAPVSLNPDQINLLAQLDKLNGADFDQEYLRQQRLAHQDAITLFTAASSRADDKFVRDWAAATVPNLRNHLDMINAIKPDNNSAAQ